MSPTQTKLSVTYIQDLVRKLRHKLKHVQDLEQITGDPPPPVSSKMKLSFFLIVVEENEKLFHIHTDI